MAVLAEPDDRVGILRLRSTDDDAALRTTCRAAVRSATLPRRGRQIMVVRSLVVGDVAAGDDAGRFRSRLESGVSAAWGRARPPSHAAGADAVVFRDHVELLAHYLSDVAWGRAASRWWWAVIGDQVAPRGASVADVLAAHPHEVPAVVVELDRLGRLDAVAALLDETGARRVLEAVVAAFSLSMPPSAAAIASGRADGGSVAGTTDRDAAPMRRTSASPWQALVRLAGMLAADPAAARSAEVLAPVAAALADGAPALPDFDDAGRAGREGRGQLLRTEHGPPTRPSSDAPSESDPGRRSPAVAADADVGRSGSVVAVEQPAASGHTEVDLDGGERTTTSPHRRPPTVDRPLIDRAVPDVFAAEPSANLPTSPHLVTDLGGVFLLVAPVLELRLGEAFGDRFESTVGWWGCIELLARSLVPLAPDVGRDPVWDVLASINGDRSAIDRIRMLRPTELRPIHFGPTNRRPGGDGSPAAPVSLDSTLASGLAGAPLGWLDRVRRSFVAHLCERLDVAADVLVDVLLRRRAAVAVDRTHVEVFFPLDAAHLAVRRAGFDRDPGWVPELGRVVLFHFGDHETDREWSP